MKLRVVFSLMLALGTMSTGCARSILSGADYSPDQNFSNYHTFGWEESDALPTGDPRLDSNPFFAQRVRSAVEEQLRSLGFVASGSPDVRVHFHAAVRDRTEVIEPDATLSARSDTPEIRYWEEGTLLIDMVDAHSDEVVWRGWAKADITGVTGSPEREEAQIRAAISRMFRRYPGGNQATR